ncbi:hypothetical protein DFH09DRAFT_1076051 [Mycena vulgaris]|nr:hypothetical protein DFH09DRAFT_1076051 [Mycena vulgaris]
MTANVPRELCYDACPSCPITIRRSPLRWASPVPRHGLFYTPTPHLHTNSGHADELNLPRTLLLTPRSPLRLCHVTAPQPQGECARTWPAALRSLDRGVRWQTYGGESGTKPAPRALALARWMMRRQLGVQVRERQAPPSDEQRGMAFAGGAGGACGEALYPCTRGDALRDAGEGERGVRGVPVQRPNLLPRFFGAGSQDVSPFTINTTFPCNNLGTREALGFEGPPTPPPDSEPYSLELPKDRPRRYQDMVLKGVNESEDTNCMGSARQYSLHSRLQFEGTMTRQLYALGGQYSMHNRLQARGQ